MDKSLNSTSHVVFNDWDSSIYSEYYQMNIWDPRFTFCRFFLYRLLDQQAIEGKITQEIASDCISSVDDKFYTENYTSRHIKEGSERICSSFTGNSSVFLFSKISYYDFKLIKNKTQLWVDFFDNALPHNPAELDEIFLAYAHNTCLNLISVYNYDANSVWPMYIQLISDVKIFYTEREYLDKMDELVEDTLTALSQVYYDMIEKEYGRFRELGIDVEAEVVDTVSPNAIKLGRLVLLDFLHNPNKMRLNEEKYRQEYSFNEVEEAYSDIYGLEDESVYMKLERCVNRLEDFNEMNAGLCRYRLDVADNIYVEARKITDMTDDVLANYIFDFFYLPTLSTVDNKEWKQYLENYTMCLSSLRILYNEGALSKQDILVAAQAFQMEVDGMILGIRDKITQECIGDLLESGEEVELIEETDEVCGIKVYKEAEDDILVTNPVETDNVGAKKMNLGGE